MRVEYFVFPPVRGRTTGIFLYNIRTYILYVDKEKTRVSQIKRKNRQRIAITTTIVKTSSWKQQTIVEIDESKLDLYRIDEQVNE